MSAPKVVRVTLQIECDLEKWASEMDVATETEARQMLKLETREQVQKWLNTTPLYAHVVLSEPLRYARFRQ